jgi:D-3-phosphoglycerate dehydrogenase / 2-oxoglutarate reductase
MHRYLVAQTDAEWFPPGSEEVEVLKRVSARLVFAECSNEEQLIELAGEADAILNSRAKITARVLQALPRCRVIARYGIGVDNIDVAAATECGIVVANVPDFCVEEVSTQVVTLLLACAKKLFRFNRIATGGNWSSTLYPTVARVAGQTFGSVGFGRIGKATVRKAKALGLRVLVYDPYTDPADFRKFRIHPCSFDELLQRSDYVSLHVPLTNETRHLIGEKALRKMKSSAFLINCARGAIVDETALVSAIEEGWIAGAGLDVLETEPPAANNPLLNLPSVILTPHSAAYSEESFRDVRRRAAEAIVRVLRGGWPRSVVNPEVRVRLRKIKGSRQVP